MKQQQLASSKRAIKFNSHAIYPDYTREAAGFSPIRAIHSCHANDACAKMRMLLSGDKRREIFNENCTFYIGTVGYTLWLTFHGV